MTMLSLDVRDRYERDRALVRGCRLVLVALTPALSDLLAQELRVAGASVAVCDGAGERLDIARRLTPQVVIVEGATTGAASSAVRLIRQDLVMRWASVLVLDWEKLCGGGAPDIETLALAIDVFVAPDRDLAERARREKRFTVQLDELGPIRILRALAETQLRLRVTFRHPRGVVEIDVADGLLACAHAEGDRAEDPPQRGVAALLAVVGISSGEVTVERVEAPRSANIVARLDAALTSVLRDVPVVLESSSARPVEALGRNVRHERPSVLEDDDAETGRFAPEILAELLHLTRRGSRAVDDETVDSGVRRISEEHSAMPASAPAPRSGGLRTVIPLLVVIAIDALLAAFVFGDTPQPRVIEAGSPVVEASTPSNGEAVVMPAGVVPAPPDEVVTPVLGPGPGEALEGSDDDLDDLGIGFAEAAAEGGDVDVLVRRANGARGRGDVVRAEELYRAALATDAENARATAGLVRVYEARGDVERAIVMAQRLARVRPHGNNYVLLGDMLLLGGNRAAAERAFERALEIDRRCARARVRLAALASSE